jgi:L-asparaginase
MVPIDDILRAVPGLKDVATVSAEQVANVGSYDMDETVWLKLLGRVQAVIADREIS